MNKRWDKQRHATTERDTLTDQLALVFLPHSSQTADTTGTIKARTKKNRKLITECERLLGASLRKLSNVQKKKRKRCREERLANFVALRRAEYMEMPKEERDKLVVLPNDKFYQKRYYAPVVVEKFKLVFLTIPKVACTQWLQLFRRMEGASDWKARDHSLPYTPAYNGLKYLTHYNLTEANRIMTSPEWTRATFVRDSKERFLSAYLDKVVNTKNVFIGACCPLTKDCVSSQTTFENFYNLTETCENEHWDLQSERFPDRIWQSLNFVGHMESVQEVARRLLEHIGAWEKYASSGWGHNGTQAIFAESTGQSTASGHATKSRNRLRQYYTPQLEQAVERRFQRDYENPVFNLQNFSLFDM